MPLTTPLPSRSIWTVDDLEQLPHDGNRYEILYGDLLVTPMPRLVHQEVAVSLTLAIGNWCRANGGWRVLATGGVHISETSWLEPDIAVYPVPAHDGTTSWSELPAPMLVVEVLSPSTTKTDRHRKRPAYLAHGVGEVWLVDTDARTTERWTAASEFPELHRGSISWSPVQGVPALVIDEQELFGPPENRANTQ